MSEWKEVRLGDVCEINPKESLKKGQIYKKIAMEDLIPYTKYIKNFSYEKFSGGSKFKNGDILLARITPSLENGKTSMVNILDENEIGFGSTEFIVFREKKNITDKHFLYYLLISDNFREIAIKSMTGTSGRQRVQKETIENYTFYLPPLPIQKKIADMLSVIDEKIETLQNINETLEEMAHILFKNLFIEEAKDEWEILELSNCVSIVDNRGKTPPNQKEETHYPVIEVNALGKKDRLVDYSVIKKYVDKKTFDTWFRNRPSKYDILISTVGSIGKLSMFVLDKGNIAQNVIALHPENISPFYLYEILKYKKEEIMKLDIGGVQPNIKVPHLLSITIPKPDRETQNKFDNLIINFVNIMELNYNQIQTLQELRNTLLPKLINGEIEVDELDIKGLE